MIIINILITAPTVALGKNLEHFGRGHQPNLLGHHGERDFCVYPGQLLQAHDRGGHGRRNQGIIT